MQPERLLTLDCARLTGWTFGTVDGSIGPKEWGVQTFAKPGVDPAEICGPAAEWLGDMIQKYRPDSLIIEMYMGMAGQKKAAVGEAQVMLHGSIYGAAWTNGRVPIYRPNVNTVRKYLCGRANASVRGLAAEVNRRRTKQMVLDRLHAIRALPREVTDDNIGDAGALFVYWVQRHRRQTPRELVMFQT